MTDAYTVIRRENALILSSDKDKQVTQYQPITRKDIPDWVIELLDGINGELGRMDALIQEAREKKFSRYRRPSQDWPKLTKASS